MPDIIITPSIGKLEFIDNSAQVTRRHSFTLDHSDGLVLDAPLSAAAISAPLNVINVTVNNSNANYPFVLAQSGETGAKNLLMDGTGGTYNPFTNTATIDISGNSATTTLASDSTNLGGVAAASYVTLTGTQTLTNKTITGTFTGNLTGTGSWATNAVSAVSATTATNSTQLNGQAASYYTNIPARLGYTPVNQAGDTIAGNLTVNGNFTVNGSVTAFSASNIYLSSSVITVEDNILTLNAFSPYLRYAGIEMYDSGSGTLSQLLWDGDGDYFFLTGSNVNGKIITGPDGQTNLSSNYVPKATAGYKLGNSLIYDNGTNIGIGNTTPRALLDLARTNNVGQVLLIGETSTNTRVGFGLDSATAGMRIFTANIASETINLGGISTSDGTTWTRNHSFGIAGKNSWLNEQGGNVGIGTTNPSYKLEVTGSLGVNASSLDTNWPFVVSDNSSAGSRYSLNKYGSMGFNNADNYAQLQLLGSAGAYVDFTNSIGGDSNARLIYYANSRLDLTYGFTTTVTLNSTGVGIGTTGPSGELHIYGSQPAFRIQSSVSGSMQFGQWDGTYNRIQSSARDFLLISTDATNLIFSTNTTERMRITSGGNVGIGTTSTAQKLDVVGNIRCVPVSSAWAEGLSFSMPTTSSWGGLRWRRERANADGNHYIGYVGTDTTDDLVFGSNNAGTQIDNNIRITKAGLVGVGTSSPVAKLHVVGVISGSSFSGAGTGLTGTAANLTVGTATNATQLGGVSAASYVTLNDTQSLTNKTITGTFTGNLTGTASTATALTSMNISQFTNNSLYQYHRGDITSLSSSATNVVQPLGTFDGSNITNAPTSGWYNYLSSTHGSYLTSLIANLHRTSDWYVGYKEGPGGTPTNPSWFKLLHSGNYSSYTNLTASWATNAVTALNGGVTSISAGTGIGTSAGTGAVTITNSSPNATHTGDVTGATTLTIANDAVTTAKILNSNVTLAKIANISTGTILGNNGAGAAAPLALTSAQVASMLSGQTMNIGGNAATATILQTARNIGGVSFNGSADINLPGVNTAGNQNTSGNAATATTATNANAISFTEVELNAPATTSGTWTTGNGSEWGEPKFGSTFNQFRYTDGDGPYVEYNVPANHHACFISQLQWDTGGYADCHGVQSDGDLVFLRRINTRQLVENSNHGNTIQHDGATVSFVGSGLGSFTKIRITNRGGRIHMTGIAFTRQIDDGYEGTGMVHPAQISHQGSGSGLNADLLDGYNPATANTTNTIVLRDTSGNFSAGTITATLSGNATTATTATTANALNTGNSYTGVNFNATGYFQTTTGFLRTDDANGIEILTTTNSAQTINVKGILIGSSYDTNPPQNEIRTSNNQSLVLNARGSGQVDIYTNDSTKVTVLNGGNVGVGTSNPGRKLDVEGIVRTRGASGSGGFEIGAATTGAAKWRIEWDSASDSLDFNWVG